MVTKSDTYIGHVVYAVIERYRIIKAASNHGALIRCRLDKVKDLVFLRRLLNFRQSGTCLRLSVRRHLEGRKEVV